MAVKARVPKGTKPEKPARKKRVVQRAVSRRPKVVAAPVFSLPEEPEISLQELLSNYPPLVEVHAPVRVAPVALPPVASPFRHVAAFFGFAMAVIAVGGIIIRTVDAATFTGPSQAAPGGNIPAIIWNRLAATATQTGASIDIDGGVAAQGMNVFGNPITASAIALTGTQNLVYGNVKSGTAGTALMLLQNAGADKLRVDTSGNVTAGGNVKSSGCMGKTFLGVTSASFLPVSGVNTYYAADAKCVAQYAGSHVCRPEEVLESISCSVAGDPIKTVTAPPNGMAWLHGGPPGFTAAANDCAGWTSNASNAYGRVWIFNTASGGLGGLTGCNTSVGLPFACCK